MAANAIEPGSLGANIACPSCGYLLRGLRGRVIVCPECGRASDVVDAVVLRRRDWSSCPPYARMLRPASCFLVILLMASSLVMVRVMGVSGAAEMWGVPLAVIAVLTGCWAYLLARSAGALSGRDGTIALLVMHIIVPGYVIAVLAFPVAVFAIAAVLDAAWNINWIELAWWGPALVGAAALVGGLWPLYRMDQWVGRTCLRHHLAEAAPRGEARGEPHSRYHPAMTIDDARSLMHEWVRGEALRTHIECVAACMAAYAERLESDPAKRDRWVITGLLHDFDYEKHPSREEHPFIGVSHLRERGDVGEEIIDAILGHAEYSGVPRTTPIAKALYAVDELAGFIVACAKVRPNGIADLAPKSVKKKLKDKAFAAGVNREDIRIGIAEMGVDETQHIQMCIDAIRGAELRLT
jgi:predicted hydrolase (HD superfamily)